MALRTRQPTGLPAWPIILVEGAEKSGKSTTALTLSASDRVARSVLFEVGERTGDAYAACGDYLMAELDGTWSTFIDQYAAATTVTDEAPNLNVIDSGTVLWDGLKDWIGARAAQSKANLRLLADDPDAAITIGNNLWNDANSRWGHFMRLTKAHKGITVVTSRAKVTSKIGAGGSPIAGQTDYKIETQKDLPNHVSAIVRCERPGVARLMACADLSVIIPSGGLELPPEGALEHLVFGVLGAGGFGDQVGADPVYGRLTDAAKAHLVDVFMRAGESVADGKASAATVWKGSPCAELARGAEVSDEAWADLLARATTAIDESEA